MNRRNFIKTSSAIIGGMILSPTISSLKNKPKNGIGDCPICDKKCDDSGKFTMKNNTTKIHIFKCNICHSEYLYFKYGNRIEAMALVISTREEMLIWNLKRQKWIVRKMS